MEERRGTRPSPSCGRERELVRGIMLALAAGLLAAGAAEVYGAEFTTTPDDPVYVNSDEALKRLYVCVDGTITLSPTIASLPDGQHTVTATCSGTGPTVTDVKSVTVDTKPPSSDINGLPLYVGAPLGSAYTHRPIACDRDAGSPVDEFARSAYTGPGNKTIPGITATTPVGTYNFWFRCFDAAGNANTPLRVRILVEPPIPSSNLNSAQSDAHLSGVAQAGYVFIPTEYKEQHGLECRPGGAGTRVENSNLVFDPWLPSLRERTSNTVKIHCIDSQGRATAATTQTTNVIVDTDPPAITAPAKYFVRGERSAVSSGIVSPEYVSENSYQSRAVIRSLIECSDSYTTRPVDAVPLVPVVEVTRGTFDYESLGDRITPQFVADQTPEDGPPIFDVLNATCTDRAGHSRTLLWILAPDRAYHPEVGHDPQTRPVFTINDFVIDQTPGPYVHQEGSVECADYLAHDIAHNALDTDRTDTRVSVVALGNRAAVAIQSMSPGLHVIPHVCIDGARAFTHTYTYAFVPSPSGPTITIDDSVTSVPAGQPVPITATCVDSDGNPRPTSREIFSAHYSTRHIGTFKENPDDTSIDRKYHAVFTCRDGFDRVAAASATFTQTAAGPRIALDNYVPFGPGQEERGSALENAHIRGTEFQDPGATCINTATGETVPHDVSGAPDENTALGKWSVVRYSCEIGGTTHEVSRHVRTLASRVVVDTPGTTSHDGRPVFVDDAACTSTLGRPIEAEVQRITGPDGGIVQAIDHTTPEGIYTIDYRCVDNTVFRGSGAPQHLRASMITHEFSKQVSVPAPSAAPFITLTGDAQRPVIPGRVYDTTVVPGAKYAEPGFTCTDRPGLGDVADVRANFTAGTVIPKEGATIEYTCTATDGDEAEPQYRRLVPLQVRINEVGYVRGADVMTASDLPTASCYLGTERIEGDLELTLLEDGRSDRKHRATQNDAVKITPRWDPDRQLTIKSWNRTHSMSFTCADPLGGDVRATNTTKFHQVPSGTLLNFPGRTFGEDGSETRGSLLRNLHIQGAEFRDGNVTCGYFDGKRFPAIKLSDDPTIITRTGEVTPLTPVSTTQVPLTYTCSPPGGASAVSLSPRVYVAERPLPVLTGLDGAPAGPHENSAPFASPVGCDGMFGGLLADDEALGHVALNHTATATGPGGEYELNDDLGIDAGAPPGQYVISHECTQTFFNREFSAEPASITVMVEAAPPPAPKPVLTLTSSEVHLMPGDTHEPPLECTVGGSTINNLILSNDTSLSRIVDGVQNVTAPDVEGAYGVKYSCESGGQTADNMPEFRVISDGTAPTVAVNASLPVVSGVTQAPPDFPISKVFACVDTYDPSPVMLANGAGGAYESGGFIPGDQFIPNTEASLFVAIRCTDQAGNTGDNFVSYATALPRIAMGIGASPAYLQPGQTHDPQVTCTVGTEQLTHLITSDSPISVIVDGKHQITAPDADTDDTTITYTCTKDDRSDTREFQVITDGVGPAPPTAPADIRIDFGTAYDPAANNVRCASDAGSPVLLDAEFAIFDSDDNEVAAITTTTAAGMYDVNYTCKDEAGNVGEAATQVVNVVAPAPSGPATALVGTAQDAYTSTPSGYEHGITCEENGVEVDDDRILFNPPLANLVENANNTVTVYCPDSRGETSKASNQTIHIVYDTERPVVSNDRPANAAVDRISLLVGEDLSDYITCADNLDKSPVLEYTSDFANYQALSEFPTGAPTSTGTFIETRCTDGAGNTAQDDDGFTPTLTVSVFAASTATPTLAKLAVGGVTQPDTDYRQSSVTTGVRLECTTPDDIAGTIMPDPSSYVNNEGEGTYPVDYTCTDDLGRTSNAVTITFVIDDTVPADPTGTAPIRVEVDDPAPEPGAGVTCPPDSGSGTAPIELQTEVRDSGNNVVTAVDTTQAATFTFLHKCVDEADNESAQVSQTVSVEAAAPRIVLTLDPTAVYQKPGTTYTPGVTCTLDGTPVNSDIASNDTSISDLVAGVQTVNVPQDEGRHPVKYSCTSGGQTAEDEPVLEVYSDNTPPELVVNASLPVTARAGVPIAPVGTPITKVYSCVDGLDPTTTMQAAGGGGATLHFPDIPGDRFILASNARYTVGITCADGAGNSKEYPVQFHAGDVPVPILSLGDSAPVHLMPGRWYVPTLTCTDEGDNINGQITWISDDLTVVRLADGRHNVTAPDREGEFEVVFSCESTDGRAARIASDDTLQIVSDGTKPRITGVSGDISLPVDADYDPQPLCVDTPPGEALPTAMITNTGDTVDTAVEDSYNEVYEGCVDRAGNEADPVTRRVTVGSPGPATALVGTAPDAYTNTPANYAHGLTCNEDGSPVDADRILFNPPLASLVENANNTVTVYCPDSRGETSKASNQTIHIVYDTMEPVVSSDRVINAGAILGLFVGEDLADHISCTDNLDKSPVFDYTNEFSEPFTYLALSTIDTSSVSRNENFPNFRCLDRAGNEAVDPMLGARPTYTVNVYDRSVTPSTEIANDGDGNPFMTTLYLDRNEQAPPVIVECADSADELQGILTPEGRFSSDTEDRHVVEYTCPDELGRVSGGVTFTFIVDETAPADPVGVAPYRIEVDEAFVPSAARAGISCPPDADPAKTADILPVLNVTLDSDGDPAEISTAAAADYEIRYFCRDLADNESAQVSQTVTVFAAAPPPTPRPVITLGATAVYLQAGTTHVPALTCALGDTDLTSSITSNDTSISDLVAGVQTVTVPQEEGRHPVKYSCESGGQTAEVEPVLEVYSDNTPPELVVNASLPVTARAGIPIAPLGTTLSKVYSCVDGVDPTTTMTGAGGGGSAFYLPAVPGDEFVLSDNARYAVGVTCTDGATNSMEYPVAFHAGDAPVPILSLGDSAPVHLMPGRWHVPVLTCADEGDLINEQITWTSDDLTVVRLADGRHNVTAPDREGEFAVTFSCESADGRAARIASDDTLEIVSDGTKPRITGVTSDPVTLALNAVYEEPEPVCTDTAPGEALPTAMITNTGDAVNTAVEAVYNEVYEGCVDRAGNEADPVARAVTVGSPAPTVPISLSGTAPNAYTSDPTTYTHPVTCDDNGADATGRIAFDPALNALVENMNNTVTLYCPEEDGTTTYREGNQTLYITYDTERPVVSSDRVINAGAILGLFVGEDLADHISCTDNLDKSPSFRYSDDGLTTEKALSEFDTGSTSTGTYLDFVCKDAADNEAADPDTGVAPFYETNVYDRSVAPSISIADDGDGNPLSTTLYLDRNERPPPVIVECSNSADGLQGILTPEGRFSSDTEDRHVVEYTCPDELGRVSGGVTFTFIVDETAPADPVGVAPYRIEVDEAFVPSAARAGISCPPDADPAKTADILPVLNVTLDSDGDPAEISTAAAADYEIRYFCRDLADNESAQVSQAVTVFAAAPPPAPKPVLTLTTSEVHLMPGDTHEPPLECTVDGNTINNLILSNDTSISRIVDGMQNVTAPDVEGAYGVKYSCESGGQTADNMPEFRVISDGTAPTVAVNASLPVVSGQVLAPTDFPISKVYACVDTYDPSPTMEANGQGGSYMSGGFVPGDQFIPNTEALVFATIRCTDEAGNVGEGTASYTTRPPPITMGIAGSPVYLQPGQTHDPQVTCTVGSDRLTHLITSSSPISVIVDGKHQITAPNADADDTTITYTCARDGLVTQTRTFQVITDGVGPAPPTAPADIRIDFGTAYDPAANNVRCASDAGSPVLLDAEFAIFDSDDNEVAAITTTTAAGMYDVNYTCKDEAGNVGEAATQVVNVVAPAPSGPATALVGTAPDAYTNTPANYAHGVTCEENGVAVDNDRILFNPPLANLAVNENNTVVIYCPDSRGETSKASNQTIHIVYDTERPVVSNDRPANAADDKISLLVGEDLSDYISCTDNLDKSPVLEYTTDAFADPVVFQALSEFPTAAAAPGAYIEFRCADRAENEAQNPTTLAPHDITVTVFATSTAQPVLAKLDVGGVTQPDTDYRQSSVTTGVRLECTTPDDIAGTIMPDPSSYVNNEGEGTYPVDYTCT
ncbi:MAG: hypothetical protein MPJ06_08685, partial [Nitrosopumilus sp.]|nr:hypothetical protein [Nitrosopumilus sp.]